MSRLEDTAVNNPLKQVTNEDLLVWDGAIICIGIVDGQSRFITLKLVREPRAVLIISSFLPEGQMLVDVSDVADDKLLEHVIRELNLSQLYMLRVPRKSIAAEA